MEYGSMSIQRLQSGRWLNWGIRFFLTAALTASQTAGGYAPVSYTHLTLPTTERV